LVGATSITVILSTQQEGRHQLVRHDTSNAATNHLTQDTHLKIIRNTATSNSKQQHAVGCEHIHIEANGDQLVIV
jgi:uncharacterized protein YifN (PemK superfamily)